MATTNLRRTDTFDRGRDFVVVRDLTVDGVQFVSGQAFDATLVTVRRLRQMYDARLIDIPRDDQPEVAATTAERSNAELIEDLTAKGVVPRPGASREWLLRKLKEATS
jgi:hypothetical protein